MWIVEHALTPSMGPVLVVHSFAQQVVHTINWVSIDYSLRPYIRKHLNSLEEVPFFKVDTICFPIPMKMVSKLIMRKN